MSERVTVEISGGVADVRHGDARAEVDELGRVALAGDERALPGGRTRSRSRSRSRSLLFCGLKKILSDECSSIGVSQHELINRATVAAYRP